MLVEHLENPAAAFAEGARCLRLGGAAVISTPNLMNYGVFGNAVASKVIPQKWHARFVHVVDGRESKDIFPVQYLANTMKRLLGTPHSSPAFCERIWTFITLNSLVTIPALDYQSPIT